MPLFLSYTASKDLVLNQGSVEILETDWGHIMLSFPYKFLLTSIKKDKKVNTFFIDLKIDLKLLLIIIIIEIDLLTKFCISNVYFNVILSPANALVFNGVVTSIDPDRGQVCQITPDWSQNLLKSHNLRFRALKILNG